MRDFRDHIIISGTVIKEALVKLNYLAKDAILFVVDNENKLIGSLTDGDIRRGLIKGVKIEDSVNQVIQSNPKFIRKGENDINKVINFREGNFKIIPVINANDQIINVINLREIHSYLPIDAVVMAGGRGIRLSPLTDNKPKPLLNIGNKPIIKYNIDRLSYFGIDDFWISINYLGDQIIDYFNQHKSNNIEITYVKEEQPLGTVGAVGLINNLKHDHVLITNSDLLTNLDYEHFYLEFLNSKAEMAVVTIPYKVNIPYAVLETVNNEIISFKEKPSFTYYSNGGIYLIKKDALKYIPHNTHFNATDLMEAIIKDGKKVFSYPLLGYWLDIGNKVDFEKAQDDIKHIKF